MNNEDFVTYEQAVSLKKLGFDWEVNHYYHDNPELEIYVSYCLQRSFTYRDYNNYDSERISAPTLAQAQKWLRKNKSYYIYPRYEGDKMWGFAITNLNKDSVNFIRFGTYQSFEDALSVGITECINLISKQ